MKKNKVNKAKKCKDESCTWYLECKRKGEGRRKCSNYFDKNIVAKNGALLELPKGRYCNLEGKGCKKYGRVYADYGGYICSNCGGRVSKWLPIAQIIGRVNESKSISS